MKWKKVDTRLTQKSYKPTGLHSQSQSQDPKDCFLITVSQNILKACCDYTDQTIKNLEATSTTQSLIFPSCEGKTLSILFSLKHPSVNMTHGNRASGRNSPHRPNRRPEQAMCSKSLFVVRFNSQLATATHQAHSLHNSELCHP